MAGLPAHIQKLDWAEQHLVKLEAVTDEFRESHPYMVTNRIEGKRGMVWRLKFLREPPPQIALIMGDVISNMRAALDYQAVALCTGHKSHVSIPTLTEPIWDIPIEDGENKQRVEDRKRWESFASRVAKREALAIIKEMQPLKSAGNPQEHVLYILNALSNKDKHRELIPVARWLKDPTIWARLTPSGPLEVFPFQRDPTDNSRWGHAFDDEAEIRFGQPPMEVHVKGAAVVTIEISKESGHYPVVGVLRETGTNLRRLFSRFEPYNVR